MKEIKKEELATITATALKNQDLLQQLNSQPASQREIRHILNDVTGQKIDDSVEIRLPN